MTRLRCGDQTHVAVPRIDAGDEHRGLGRDRRDPRDKVTQAHAVVGERGFIRYGIGL
jgi:hypothetical protein